MQIDLHTIIKAFQIPKLDYDIKELRMGHINYTYKVVGDPHSYLLQRINTDVFRDPILLMQNIHTVSEHLKNKKYPYPILSPYGTKAGSHLYIDGLGQHWRLFDFFEDTYAVNRVENQNQAYAGGQVFGHFMAHLADLPTERVGLTIQDFHNGGLRWLQFQKAIAADKAGRRSKVESLIKEVSNQQAIFQEVNTAEQLPIRITHNDTKINNLLFDKKSQNAKAVIDWDTIMPATILSDFGDMVRTFTSSADEEERDLSKVYCRLDIFEGMAKGFLSEMKGYLLNIEKRLLVKGGIWMTYMQVIRFLSDYLNGDTYYQTNDLEHNLHRTLNQLQLLKDLIKNKEEMERMVRSIQ